MKPRKSQPSTRKPKPASAAAAPQIVTIEKPVYGGNFLARPEGKAVFVPMTLPGEQVRIHLVEDKAKRGYALAELDGVVTRAPERIDAKCPHFGACGGCNYQHTGYENQLRMKESILRETLERGGVPLSAQIDVLSAQPWQYRNRIRLAFDADGNPGYRARRSSEVVAISTCPIAAPLLVQAALTCGEVMTRVPANLRPHEVALFTNADESALLATFFIREAAGLRLEALAASLAQRIPALSGVELATGGRPGNPPRTVAAWGQSSLTYRVAGTDYRVDHGAFFQVNRWLVDTLVDRVTREQEGALAWDLFAGVGLFARQLTTRFHKVLAVESAPTATAALAANLAGTSGEAVALPTLPYLRAQAGSPRPDLIVVDPPRTGLEAPTTTLLTEIAAPRLVYVSCDPATLARDLRALLAGGYAIEAIAMADLFPQTFHLETVVHLRRS